MTAVLIDHPQITKSIVEEIVAKSKYSTHGNIVFITNYYFIKEKIEHFGIECVTVSEFLNEEDIIEADLLVERICCGYYFNSENIDVSLYKGISLGLVGEFPLWAHIVTPRVRLISIINKLINQKCSFLFLDKNIQYADEIACCIIGVLNCKLMEYNYDIVPHPVKGSLDSFKLRNNNNLKTFLLSVYFLFVNIITKLWRGNNANILIWAESYLDNFFEYIFTYKQTWNLFLFDNKRPANIPKIKYLFNPVGIFPSFMTIPKRLNYDLDGFNKNLELSDVFIFNGINYKSLFQKPILDFINEFFPLFKAEINYFLRKIKRSKISHVVLYADTPPLNRILCLICKKLGLKSIVVQHGFKDYPNDMDMNIADYAFVWSQKTIDDYLSKRNNQKKAFVVGNPLFQKFAKIKTQYTERCILIISHSFYNLSNYSQIAHQEIYLRQALQNISESHPDYSIIFKPHPSEELSVYTNFLFPRLNLPLKFSVYLGDINDAIRKSMIVFCANSTAGIEAYLQGSDVFIINVTHRKFSYPFSKAAPSMGIFYKKYIPAKLDISEEHIEELCKNSSQRVVNAIETVIENIRFV